MENKKDCIKNNNNYVVRFVTSQDKDLIMNLLMNDFLTTEPINCSISITKEQINPIFQDLIKTNFVINNSFGAFSEDGKLVGIRLVNMTQRKEDCSVSNKISKNNINVTASLSPDIVLSMILNEAKIGIWKELPDNINVLIRTEISCVSKDWQRKGIATRLENEGNMLLKNKFPEIQGVIAEATSVANQNLLKKQGYKTYRNVYFKNFDIPIGYDGSTHVETMIKLF
uniref:N-acetyltransferase domain-containing protein n=1 Tax=Parastrongyloides trichosuri TaxID=131310 RepID=A0A0N4ZIA2_PARTI